MKQLMLLIMISFLFIGCEKERCFECTTSYSINISNEVSVICGTMTRKEAQDYTGSGSITVSGVKVSVTCREL